MMRRVIAASFLAIGAMLGLAGESAAQALSGAYYGVDDAAGASISIEPAGEGFEGTFFDARGNAQAFEAARNGEAAETALDMDQRKVLMRMEPVPFGAKVTLVPLDAEGRADVAAGRVLHFVRSGLELPKPDADFVAAPSDARGRITANSFLASYEFWSPVGVRNGYLALPERFRTLMRLYPAVQLDLIWKLCLAPEAGEALALALRGQGVTCAEAIDGIAEAQRSGRFDAFKREVRDQRTSLRTTVRCADGYPEPKEACDRAARELSTQAVSLDTAATVLGRYR